jgi:hypothetical protein
MSYSSSDADSFKRAGSYMDKLLKGAKPAIFPLSNRQIRVGRQSQDCQANRINYST